MPTKEELAELQALPLDIKILTTKARIREWVREYGTSGVYVSLGGKDSRVLLHIIREMFPYIPAMFVNTGLEFPELRNFNYSLQNVEFRYPKMNFVEVIKKYGYPIISKEVSKRLSEYRNAKEKGCLETCTAYLEFNGLRNQKDGGSFFNKVKWKPLTEITNIKFSHKCCVKTKEEPALLYEREKGLHPFIGSMAEESITRKTVWLVNGCNSFDSKRPVSNPISFWTNQDILRYIKIHNLDISSVYGDIVECDRYGGQYNNNLIGEPIGKLITTGRDRTGCMYCAFGMHLEKGKTRFQLLKETHPKQYEYCVYGGEFDKDGFWQPNKNGLGWGFVFDEINKIYGENFYRYK